MAWGNPGYPQAGSVTLIPLPSGALEVFGPDGASLGTLTPGVFDLGFAETIDQASQIPV